MLCSIFKLLAAYTKKEWYLARFMLMCIRIIFPKGLIS
jgi:hypothetical protein